VTGEITFRQAVLADLPGLVRLRRMMFESMGESDQGRLDAGDAAAGTYFAEAIPSGEFHGWVAVAPDGRMVSSGGAVIDRHPPGPGNLSGQIAYIMNIVTVPENRRQGIARQMMQVILAWCATQGITRVALHTSHMGRPLYESLGFMASNEMRLALRQG